MQNSKQYTTNNIVFKRTVKNDIHSPAYYIIR